MSGTFSPADMELTPAKVYFTPAASTAEVYLGGTLSNVKINFGYDKADLKADQTGTTIIDRRISGFQGTVEFEIAQVNDYELWAMLFPHSDLLGNAPFTGSAPSAAVQFNNQVGASDQAVAGALRLHPQVFADGIVAWDWTFFKAAPQELTELSFSPTEQSRYKVSFQIYPDIISESEIRFFRRGDTTIV